MIFGKHSLIVSLLVASSAHQVTAINRANQDNEKAKSLFKNMLPKFSTKETILGARHLAKPVKNMDCIIDTGDIMPAFMEDTSLAMIENTALLSQMMGCMSTTECTIDFSVLKDELQGLCEEGLGGHYVPVDIKGEECVSSDEFPLTAFMWLSHPFCVATSCTEGDAWFLFKKMKQVEPYSLCDTKFKIADGAGSGCEDSTGKGPAGKSCSKVAKKAKKWCKKKKFRDFCPETCGACPE
jgi:hypothetical protein